jgi:hypothetical protein
MRFRATLGRSISNKVGSRSSGAGAAGRKRAKGLGLSDRSVMARLALDGVEDHAHCPRRTNDITAVFL